MEGTRVHDRGTRVHTRARAFSKLQGTRVRTRSSSLPSGTATTAAATRGATTATTYPWDHPGSGPHQRAHPGSVVYYILLPTRRISSAADFFRGRFLLRRIFANCAGIPHLHLCMAAARLQVAICHYTSDVIGVICRMQGAVIQLAMPPWLCFNCLFTLPVSCVMFQTSVNKSTPNFCTPCRDDNIILSYHVL